MRLLLLSIFLVMSLQAKSFFSNSQQADSSVYIGALKDLIIATQKTRGLTNSYLNGNPTAMLLVYSNRDDMKTAIGTMESLPLAADTVINARATAISQALIKLNNKAFKMKASDVFSGYTEQIGQTLMLAQTVNKRFSKDLSPFGQQVSTIMMEIMLPMTEYVGQMRGFGAGLAAKGSVEQSQYEKIIVLANQIQKLNKKLQSEMMLVASQHKDKYASNIQSEISAVDNAVGAYITFAQNNFKDTASVKNVDPDDYFEQGTKLISLIIKAYNTNNKALLEDSKGWF
jgi:hypothetical protein